MTIVVWIAAPNRDLSVTVPVAPWGRPDDASNQRLTIGLPMHRPEWLVERLERGEVDIVNLALGMPGKQEVRLWGLAKVSTENICSTAEFCSTQTTKASSRVVCTATRTMPLCFGLWMLSRLWSPSSSPSARLAHTATGFLFVPLLPLLSLMLLLSLLLWPLCSFVVMRCSRTQ